MAAYCYSSVISEHIVKDNAGFLVCLAAPICRSGWQSYRHSEIDPGSGDDSIVTVYRPVEEVTSPATVSSANGKPLVGVGHPAKFVDPSNASWVSKGHIQNIRVGKPDENGDTPLLADLHVHDEALIYQIQNGVRELSCGYEYELDEGPTPGTYVMRNLRMNHCAVVPQGRAGNARIIDAPALDSFAANAARYLGRDPMEVARAENAPRRAADEDFRFATEGEEPMPKKTRDEADDLDARLDKILALLERFVARHEAADNEQQTKDADLLPTEAWAEVDRPRNPTRATARSASDAAEQASADFGASCAQYLGKPVIVGEPRTTGVDSQRAEDSDYVMSFREYRNRSPISVAEDFERSAREARDVALGRRK